MDGFAKNQSRILGYILVMDKEKANMSIEWDFCCAMLHKSPSCSAFAAAVVFFSAIGLGAAFLRHSFSGPPFSKESSFWRRFSFVMSI